MRALPQVILWAVIVRNPRTDWIFYPSLKRTQREARAAYLDGWDVEGEGKAHWRRELRKGNVRLRRVSVVERVTP